jgi:aquaporin related protein
MLLKDSIQDHLMAIIGEFVETFLFLFFAFAGTQTISLPTGTEIIPDQPDPSILLYISLAFGFSLAINVWIFFRVSGGLFNPAVTLGLYLVGAVPLVRYAGP